MLFTLACLLYIASFGFGHLQNPLREQLDEPRSYEGGNPLTPEFGEYVTGLLDRFKVPSLTIAVIHNSSVYSAAYGTAVFPDVPATPETLYYTGSTTKSFTSAALTLLVDSTSNDSHPLRLTDPLYKHLPGFRLASEYATLHTTIEDALSHRSGFPRHDQVYGASEYSSDDLIAALPYLPLTAEPRTKFQYCNIMFMLASRVVENVSGMPLGKFLKMYLWEPFRMTSTYFSLLDAQIAERNEGKQLARGYSWDEDVRRYVEQPWMDASIVSGAGNTISNVLDYAQYLSAMLTDKPPISERGYRELRTARTIIRPFSASPFSPGTMSYSLGWQQQVYRDQEMFSHGGGLPGFGAEMSYLPAKKWAVAMMGNTEARSNMIGMILTNRLIDDLLDVPKESREDLAPLFEIQLQKWRIDFLNSTRRLYPDVPKPPIPLSRPLETYTGEYWHPAYRNLTLTLGTARYPRVSNDSMASKAARFFGTGGRTEKVLQTRSTNKVWQAEIQLEHVSGEHFVVWSLPISDKACEYALGDSTKAEFRIAANGTVESVGLALEPLMGEDKIWFEREY